MDRHVKHFLRWFYHFAHFNVRHYGLEYILEGEQQKHSASLTTLARVARELLHVHLYLKIRGMYSVKG